MKCPKQIHQEMTPQNYVPLDHDSTLKPGDLLWVSMYAEGHSYYEPAIYVGRPSHPIRVRQFMVYLPTLKTPRLIVPHSSRLHMLVQ